MPVDYRKQYETEQLEPFWPNAAIRGIVAALCTLAVLTVLAVLPVILDAWDLGHWMEQSDPADPRKTPLHIRPEWYFLASYQSLKLFPMEWLGLSGRTLGVLGQGVAVAAIVLLPFWARRWAQRPPGWGHVLGVTVAAAAYLGLTLWAAWPPTPLMTITVCTVVLLFCALVGHERRRIRRIMGRRGEPGG